MLYSGFEWIHEPNASSESSGVTYLDDFIHANFRLVQQFGDYAIWMNEREPAPAASADPGAKTLIPISRTIFDLTPSAFYSSQNCEPAKPGLFPEVTGDIFVQECRSHITALKKCGVSQDLLAVDNHAFHAVSFEI